MLDAALTEQEQQWITAAGRHYALSQVTSAERVSDVNPLSRCHIFRLTCGECRFALKVYPMGWWPDRLYRAHAAAEFLSDRGFPAPRPLRTNTGDRVLFLGENPAICTTWLPGHPLWDPLPARWLSDEQTGACLLSVMEQLAVFHDLMSEYRAEPTRIRAFPPIDWYSQRVAATCQLAAGANLEFGGLLNTLADTLAGNAFPESFMCQHVLIDCHPGQFLFDGNTFTGMVDFDHVATAFRFRDLSKLLSTDSTTLSQAPGLIAAYLSAGSLPDEQRECLPAGTLRYLVTSAIQKIHKAATEQLLGESVCESFHRNVQTFFRVLPELKATLGIDCTPGIPEGLPVD